MLYISPSRYALRVNLCKHYFSLAVKGGGGGGRGRGGGGGGRESETEVEKKRVRKFLSQILKFISISLRRAKQMRKSMYNQALFTRGYQKVLSLTWKEPEIWIYSALFFNVVPFQLHTLVPSSFPVINTRSVEVNILVP